MLTLRCHDMRLRHRSTAHFKSKKTQRNTQFKQQNDGKYLVKPQSCVFLDFPHTG